jgi:hypothetical protein
VDEPFVVLTFDDLARQTVAWVRKAICLREKVRMDEAEWVGELGRTIEHDSTGICS